MFRRIRDSRAFGDEGRAGIYWTFSCCCECVRTKQSPAEVFIRERQRQNVHTQFNFAHFHVIFPAVEGSCILSDPVSIPRHPSLRQKLYFWESLKTIFALEGISDISLVFVAWSEERNPFVGVPWPHRRNTDLSGGAETEKQACIVCKRPRGSVRNLHGSEWVCVCVSVGVWCE